MKTLALGICFPRRNGVQETNKKACKTYSSRTQAGPGLQSEELRESREEEMFLKPHINHRYLYVPKNIKN